MLSGGTESDWAGTCHVVWGQEGIMCMWEKQANSPTWMYIRVGGKDYLSPY